MIDPGYVGAGRRRDILASIEMRRASCTAFRRCGKLIDAKFLALALTMLGGCSTIIGSHTNPSGQAPSQWAEIDRLPIELHGNIPGLSASDLTSRLRTAAPKLLFASNGALPIPSGGRRVVIFVNASSKVASNALCDAGENFHAGTQTGPRANVSGVLCDGRTVISTVSASVVTQSRPVDGLVSSFRIIRDELYWTLYANNYGE